MRWKAGERSIRHGEAASRRCAVATNAPKPASAGAAPTRRCSRPKAAARPRSPPNRWRGQLRGRRHGVTAARGGSAPAARGSLARTTCGDVEDRLLGHAGARGAVASRCSSELARRHGRLEWRRLLSTWRELNLERRAPTPRAPLRPCLGRPGVRRWWRGWRGGQSVG